uniref:uncharacterized protein K02A2.6-like n=1 Tax=Anopheles coluzzii TaxID=1518534 RepID=UPI0020FFB5CA|nr:uncharacterized protein K02A2.6-like [Anopheles coluzzii]
MEQADANQMDVFADVDPRRLSQNRASVPGVSMPNFAHREGASVVPPMIIQPPSQPTSTPSQPTSTPSLINASPAIISSADSATMLQMMNLLQQQMAQQQQLLKDFLHAQFQYNKETGITFKSWFSRYLDLFQKDAARIDDAAKTVENLTCLFDTQESLLSKRFKCLQIMKTRTEDHLSYACRINKACVEFELKKLNEEEFKCLLYMCGLKDEIDADIRTRLLARIEDKACVTLQQLSSECHRLINLKKDSAMIEAPVPERVLAVNTKMHRAPRQFQPKRDNPTTPCWSCGGLHWSRDCPYKQHRCTTCSRTGHKEGYCNTIRSRKPSKRPWKQRKTQLRMVNVQSVQQRRRFVSLTMNGTPVRMQLDTASDITVIDHTTWKLIGSPQLAAPSVIARTASGANLSLEGEFPCTVEVNGQVLMLSTRLLYVRFRWTVFAATLQKSWARIVRLEKLGIITPVKFSEWAAPVVVVKKANGKIRLCGDHSTGLNEALRPHDYPLPLPEDIFSRLSNCTMFSKIDLTDAFLQVEIDPQYRLLLTINTHRGLYHYNHLPPGIKVAPAAFQQLKDTMLAGLKGVSGYLDDIIVGGSSEHEHDTNLAEVLHRLQEYGFTIRADKCAFKQQKITYLGHVIDSHGLRPDPSKIELIKKLPEPKDISGMRSFLGAINYNGKFIPNMRKLRYPLDNLLKANNSFCWTPECKKSFATFKSLLSSDLLLTHYNPRQKIIVSADASSIGLGATISHVYPGGAMRVIQHASRALSEAERHYSQIDREGLAIIFAVKKFHKMIFGRRFVLQTDHRPLLHIFGSKNGIPTVTANRLQRFALTLLAYDFSIEYVRTDDFENADLLSRVINTQAKLEEDTVIACIETDIKAMVVSALHNTPLHFADLIRETRKDPLLQKLVHYIREGWPSNATYTGEFSRFFARKDALSTVDGCILFWERVVIPRVLQQQCLQQIHHGHPGIQRMKALARSYLYWPSLDADITEWVKTCNACQAVARSPPHSSPVPWQRIHVDYAGPLDGDFYLIVVDSFTKWPEVFRTSSTTSAATIGILRGIFARYGVPTTLVSHNGTQFTSEDFKFFCFQNGIEHITTAPYHPQSNGQAERFVDTFKRTVKKISADGRTMQEALDAFLLSYRSTPSSVLEGLKSPAEIMFGSPMRTTLDLLRPPLAGGLTDSPVAAKRREFRPSDLVYVKCYSRNGWSWTAGTIVSRIGNVMYTVRTVDRKTIRSHVNQLRERRERHHHRHRESSESDGLPLDILLDSYHLTPQPTTSTAEPSSASLQHTTSTHMSESVHHTRKRQQSSIRVRPQTRNRCIQRIPQFRYKLQPENHVALLGIEDRPVGSTRTGVFKRGEMLGAYEQGTHAPSLRDVFSRRLMGTSVLARDSSRSAIPIVTRYTIGMRAAVGIQLATNVVWCHYKAGIN